MAAGVPPPSEKLRLPVKVSTKPMLCCTSSPGRWLSITFGPPDYRLGRRLECHSVQLISISMGIDDDVVNGETRPLAGLPGADRRLLARAPLELAIVEVRFAGVRNLPNDAGLQLRERLGAGGLHLTRLEPRQTQQVKLTPGVTPTVEFGTNGWLLTNPAGTIQVTLLPEAAVFQTATYHRWSASVRPSLEALLAAVGELASPSVVIRIGLRYVNRFVDPTTTTVTAWKGRIDKRFLGPICYPRLGDLVRSSQQQVELAFSDNQGAILRHGPFVDRMNNQSVSYLLDIDCYDSTPSNFDVAELAKRAEVLNRTAASLFQSVITEDYRHQLQSDGHTDEERVPQ